MVRRAGRCPKHSLQDPWSWTLRGRGFCPRACHCGTTITITITITTITTTKTITITITITTRTTTTVTQPASETPAAGLQRPLGLLWWAWSPRELSAGPGLDGPCVGRVLRVGPQPGTALQKFHQGQGAGSCWGSHYLGLRSPAPGPGPFLRLLLP